MSRRRMVRPSDTPAVLGDKPTLEGVLDNYGIDYVPSKIRQMIRCPLHDDRTASCSINLDKQVWKCHSCGEGGDSWQLIKLKEDIDFDRAREFARTAQLVADGDAGGGGLRIRGGAGSQRGPVPRGSRTGSGDGSYVPSWRRRNS